MPPKGGQNLLVDELWGISPVYSEAKERRDAGHVSGNLLDGATPYR